MATLSKTQIQAASDIVTELVPVPEWGGDVAVRMLTATERDVFEQSLIRTGTDGKREPDLANMRAKLCAACIVDGVTGDRLFADHEVDQLGNKSGAVLDRITKVAQRLNGMGADAVDQAEKNSEPAPSGPSTSA